MSQICHRLDSLLVLNGNKGYLGGWKLSGAWDCRVKTRDLSCKVFISDHLGFPKCLFQASGGWFVNAKKKEKMLGSQNKSSRSQEGRKNRTLDEDLNAKLRECDEKLTFIYTFSSSTNVFGHVNKLIS